MVEENIVNIRLTLENQEAADFKKLMSTRGFTLATETVRVLIAEEQKRLEGN
jgi:hypothetical protein